MENVRDEQENFEVLGLRLRLKRDEMLPGVTPREVVDFVQSEAQAILNKNQNINLNQAVILAALKIAQEKIALEKQLMLYNSSKKLFLLQIKLFTFTVFTLDL